MKTLNQLGIFETQSYKGYLIKFSGIHNIYYVSKDNVHIYSNAALSDIKFNIDLIANLGV
jgi:hypothetical protein